jgi:hypothetical protein
MTHSKKTRAVWVLAAVTVLVAACGGGSGSAGQAPGPMSGAIANQSVNQDTAIGPLPVTVYASFTERADTIFGENENAMPAAINGLTFEADADGTPNAFSTLLQ